MPNWTKKTAQITVDLGILKLSLAGEIDGQDREVSVRVLERLADHRALRSSHESEYAGAVVRSVKDLRDWTQNEIEKLRAIATVRQPVRMIIRGCRTFISDIEGINNEIVKKYEAAKAWKDAGSYLYDDQKLLISTVERVGSSNLLLVEDLNLMQLPTTGMTWEFLFAMQRLRTTVGFAVRILEAIGESKAPRELRRLLPEDIEAD
jgi:hypothetical protein